MSRESFCKNIVEYKIQKTFNLKRNCLRCIYLALEEIQTLRVYIFRMENNHVQECHIFCSELTAIFHGNTTLLDSFLGQNLFKNVFIQMEVKSWRLGSWNHRDNKTMEMP